MFGLGAGTIGALLRFVGEPDLAYGAPLEAVQAGGTIRVGIPAFGASLEPYLLNEGGSLAFAGMPGEYLTFTTPDRVASCRARDELEGERRRDRVDVPDPAGRQVPQRQDAHRPDVVASMKQYVGEELERRPLAVLRRVRASRRGGSTPSSFRLKSPIGVFPYLVSQTTYQAIIQPAAIAAKPGTWVKAG